VFRDLDESTDFECTTVSFLCGTVSAKHAVITCEVIDAERNPPELEIKIVDLSRNGVWLNGERLVKDRYYPMNDGDVVTLPFHLEYRFELNPGRECCLARRACRQRTTRRLCRRSARRRTVSPFVKGANRSVFERAVEKA
jgi:hypothetical protein